MGWLSGWNKRKSHVINQQVGACAGYQTCIKVYKGAGADGNEAIAGTTVTAGKVYCGGNCQNDFGDIRFTDNDGSTLLDYWMMELSAGNYAIFWVRVTDDLGAGNQSIYVYYDTAGATATTSNIATTFPILGDDFDGAAEPPAGWNENNIHDNRVSWSDVSELSYYKVWSFQDTSAWWHGNEIYKNIGVQVATLAVMSSIFQACGIVVDGKPQHHSVLELKLGGVSKLYNGYNDSWSGTIGRYYSYITGTDGSEAPGTRTINTTTIYETLRDGTNYKNYHGGALQQTKAENTNIDEVRFCFIGGASLSTTDPHSRLNWVVIRKYVSPEPTHGGWGAEETPTPPTADWNHAEVGLQGVEDCIIDYVISWDEEEGIPTPVKRLVRKDSPTTQVEYFTRLPRIIELEGKATKTHRNCLEDLKHNHQWLKLYDGYSWSDERLIDNVWLEYLSSRWAGDEDHHYSWHIRMTLICSTT